MATKERERPPQGPPVGNRSPSLDPVGVESLEDTDRRVWDLVYNLVHPAALYVLFQLLMISHLGDSPPLRGHHPLAPISLAIYGAQFLGAWAVFYTTLLRDMGYRSAAGTILLLAALGGAVGQYLLFPAPATADSGAVWAFLGVQLALAVVLWPTVFVPWRREKRRQLARLRGEPGEASR